ncbi:MAG: hypothetical protein R3E10_00540 [Gemmatimonadota bacterium]
MDLWGQFNISEYEPVRRPLGEVRLALRMERGELIVTVDTPASASAPWASGVQEERWTAPGPAASVTIEPALPDRPIVIGVTNPFRIAPGAEVRLQVQVPVWARIHLEDPARTLLAEVASTVLSPTWWGGKTRGELAYWLPARVEHTDAEVGPATAATAVCLLRVTNRSRSVLDVTRLAIRAPLHTLFATERGLVTDEAKILYTGEDSTEIDVGARPPSFAPHAPNVQRPRQFAARGLKALTFAHLRSLELY